MNVEFIQHIKGNDCSTRRAYWVLSNVLEKVDKKHLKGMKKDFLEFQIPDAQKALISQIRANWEVVTKEFVLKKHEGCGDLMTVSEWLNDVEISGFIDYDGFGSLATETQVSDIEIKPSDITVFKLPIPTWATHIMWYNR